MWVRLLTIVSLLLGLMLFLCKLPSPPPGPESSFVALEFKSSIGKITKDTLTDSIDKKFNICMIHNQTQYIDSSVLRITKGTTINESFSVKYFKGQVDTTYYLKSFSDTGSYAVSFTGYIEGKPTTLNGTIIISGQPQTTKNQKPVLNLSKAIKTGVGQELSIPVSATDPDVNQQVTIIVEKKPVGATFTANVFKWTPAIIDTGSFTVIFTATDNGSPALSTTDSCVITVSTTPVNRAPQWSIASIERATLPEVLFSQDVSSYCIDPDNDNLTFSLLAQAPAKDTIIGNMYQFTPALTDTGVHSISIVASDPAGLSDTFTLKLTISTTVINIPDKVPPIISFRSPSKDTVISVDSCEIKVTCVDDSGCSVAGYCNGIAFTMVKVPSVPNLWTGMVKGLPSGNFTTIKVIATDSAAARNTDSASVRIKYDGDTTKPALTRVTPSSESASTNVSNYTITVSCTDAIGIASVVGTMGTQTFAGTKGTANVWTIAITGLSSTAVNTVTVTATDSSLRANKSTLAYSITYDPTGADNTPPRVYFTNPVKDTVVGVDTFTVTAVCVDPSKISSLVGKRDTTTFSMSRTAVDSIWTGVVKGLPSGRFATIKLIATDSATARNKDSVTVNIKYDGDTTKPALTRITPAVESASTNANSYTITVNCTDASGVASVVGTMGTQTFAGTKGTANVWTIAVTGLSSAAVNAVVVTAIDSSLRANKSTLNFSITSDPTMLDTIGPTITDVSGPLSGSTVTAAVVDIVKGISDPSDIDSVYWTKNGGAKKVMSPVTGNAGQYALKDTLTEGRGDTLVITAVDKATRHNKKTQTIVLKYVKAPEISVQPVSQTICSGSKATFSVTATGTAPLSYQWRTGSTNPANISGATSSTYSPGTTTADQTVFSCVVSNGSGVDAVSNSCTLAYYASPTITGPTNQSVCSGNATLSISATGATGYQWYNGSTSGSGTEISGATSAKYSASAGSYWCKVNYGTGCSTNSSVATVTVTATPTISGPTNQTVSSGSKATLSVSVTGATATGYQWYSGTTSGSGTEISGATSATYSASAGSYWCKVSYGTGCSTNSSVATVTVIQVPTNVTATSPICSGSTAELTADAPSIGTLHWYSSACGTGAVGTGTSITTSALTTNTTFYVRAEQGTSYGPCASVNVTVTALSVAATSINATNANPCPGTNVTLSVSGGSLGSGATWKWYTNSTCTQAASGTALQNNGSQFEITPSITATYYVRAEGSCNKTAVVSRTITVQNESSPATGIYSDKGSSFCNGDSITLSVIEGSLGSNATWKWYTNSGCTTPAPGRTLVSDGSQIKVGPKSTTTYYVRAEGGCNPTTTKNIKLTNLSPTITKQPATVSLTCNNIYNIEFSVSAIGISADDNLSYQWVKDNTVLHDEAGMIGGTTTPTVSFFGVESYAGKYYCIISNSNCSISSDEVEFIWLENPPCP